MSPKPIFFKKILPHLVFWLLIVGFSLGYFSIVAARSIHPVDKFADYQTANRKAELSIRLSQPVLRMSRGKSQYEMDGWIVRTGLPDLTWDDIRIFLVDKQDNLYWIATQTDSDPIGYIQTDNLSDPEIGVRVHLPEFLIPPGVYQLGAELCSKDNECFYSLHTSREFYVTPNSIQFVKPKNLSKIQSIGTRQRVFDFLSSKFFPEPK